MKCFISFLIYLVFSIATKAGAELCHSEESCPDALILQAPFTSIEDELNASKMTKVRRCKTMKIIIKILFCVSGGDAAHLLAGKREAACNSLPLQRCFRQ